MVRERALVSGLLHQSRLHWLSWRGDCELLREVLLDVLNHLLEEVIRFLNLLAPTDSLKVKLFFNVLSLQCLVLVLENAHSYTLGLDFLKSLCPLVQEAVNLEAQGLAEEVQLYLRQCAGLHAVKVQMVQVLWNLPERRTAGQRILLRRDPHVGEKKGSELFPLPFVSRVLGPLLVVSLLQLSFLLPKTLGLHWDLVGRAST